MKTIPAKFALILTFLLSLALPLIAGRVPVPLDTADHALKIMGPKEMKVEQIEGGGIRITCPASSTRNAVDINYQFSDPAKAAAIGVEIKQTPGVERTLAACTLQNGKRLLQFMEDLGTESIARTIDLSSLAAEKKFDLDSPVAVVRIAFRTKPDSGEQVVELKNWWIE